MWTQRIYFYSFFNAQKSGIKNQSLMSLSKSLCNIQTRMKIVGRGYYCQQFTIEGYIPVQVSRALKFGFASFSDQCRQSTSVN